MYGASPRSCILLHYIFHAISSRRIIRQCKAPVTRVRSTHVPKQRNAMLEEICHIRVCCLILQRLLKCMTVTCSKAVKLYTLPRNDTQQSSGLQCAATCQQPTSVVTPCACANADSGTSLIGLRDVWRSAGAWLERSPDTSASLDHTRPLHAG